MISKFEQIRKKPKRTFEIAKDIPKILLRVKSSYKSSWYQIFKRSFFLYRQNFKPEEALVNNLYNPATTEENIRKFLSKNRLKHIQRNLNPADWIPLVQNKSLFYNYCIKNEIPVPKFIGLFYKHNSGVIFNELKIIETKNEWINYFQNYVPDVFVIKPSDGEYGKGVNVLVKKGSSFYNYKRKNFTAEELYNYMNSFPNYNSFIIQERITNCSEIRNLSNSNTLQNLRLNTHIDKNGKVHIIAATMKIAVGENDIDNLEFGLTGNVLAILSVQSGRILDVIQYNFAEHKINLIKDHPITGKQLVNFEIPLWKDCCTLIKETAIKFFPLRNIGWDVAVTENGPVIIEGNIFWDPTYYKDHMVKLAAEMKL